MPDVAVYMMRNRATGVLLLQPVLACSMADAWVQVQAGALCGFGMRCVRTGPRTGGGT